MHTQSARVETPVTSDQFGLSVPKFAEKLGVSKAFVWSLLAEGKIKAVRLGKRRIIPSSELTRILSGEA